MQPTKQQWMASLAGLKPDLELFDALSIDVAPVHLFVIDITCLSKRESSFHYCGFGGFLLCITMKWEAAIVGCWSLSGEASL